MLQFLKHSEDEFLGGFRIQSGSAHAGKFQICLSESLQFVLSFLTRRHKKNVTHQAHVTKISGQSSSAWGRKIGKFGFPVSGTRKAGNFGFRFQAQGRV
jgi:hypothetical protein